MRFGIQPVSVDSVIGQIKDSRNITNSLKLNFTKIVLDAVKRGYRHIEISLDMHYVLPEGFQKKDIENLLKIKEEHNITYSVHLPLWSIELSSPNRYIRKGSTDCLINAVKIVEPLDPEVYVLHATGALAAEFSRIEIPEQYKKIVMNIFTDNGVSAINRMIKETNLDPNKLALETIEFPLENTLDQIKKVKGAKLCIDTGHVLAKYPGDYDLFELTKKYIDITSEFHLHDGYNFPNRIKGKKIEDHIALGEGQLPIKFLKLLYEKNFRGPIVFELNFDQAKKSLEFIKKHVPEIEIDLND